VDIDDRLQRLTERHEALSQSLELMQHMQQENQALFNARFGKVTDALEKLAAIAQSHEHRIQRLEDK